MRPIGTEQPLNRGHPPFWPQILKITSFGHRECVGGGGGGQGATAAGLCYLAWGGVHLGGQRGEEGRSALVLDAACLKK